MKTRLIVASAVAAAFAMPLATGAQSGPAPTPKFAAEKCYGISKAARNDCQTANSSCAGFVEARRAEGRLDLRAGRLVRPHRRGEQAAQGLIAGHRGDDGP